MQLSIMINPLAGKSSNLRAMFWPCRLTDLDHGALAATRITGTLCEDGTVNATKIIIFKIAYQLCQKRRMVDGHSSSSQSERN